MIIVPLFRKPNGIRHQTLDISEEVLMPELLIRLIIHLIHQSYDPMMSHVYQCASIKLGEKYAIGGEC